MDAVIAMELFEAYAQNKLAKNQGLIISAFFKTDNKCVSYEVVSYSELKDIYMTDRVLNFKGQAKKIKLVADGKSELIFSKKPETPADGFKVFEPEGINFSFIFYDEDKGAIKRLEEFLIKSMNQEAGISLADAEKTAKQFLDVLNS